MARGQKRSKEEKLREELEKVEKSILDIDEKKKSLVERKNALEKELDSCRVEALISLIDESGLSLKDVEELINKKKTIEE